MGKLRISGCDPGFANIGFGVVDLYSVGASELLDVRLVTTAKGKGKIKLIDDELRRLHEIEDAFIKFLDEWQPDVCAIEEPGKCLMVRAGKWQTNPSLLRTACLMWGSISGICRARGIYVIKCGSQEIKKAICGVNSASKPQMEKVIKKRYPAFQGWPSTKKVEHVVDAVSAAVTAFKEPFVMTTLRALEAQTS